MNTRMNQKIRFMAFVGCAVASGLPAWADVALANAVFETEGRAAGTLAMNADYTQLVYTAPKAKGLVLIYK